MRQKLTATQITDRITRINQTTDIEAGTVQGFDRQQLLDFLLDQYANADSAPVTLAALPMNNLHAIKTALYHDLVKYEDSSGQALAAIKWTTYGASSLVTLLAALNINSAEVGGKPGSTAYSITQIALSVVAVGIIKMVCEPITQTNAEVMDRLKAARALMDDVVASKPPVPPLLSSTVAAASTLSLVPPIAVSNEVTSSLHQDLLAAKLG